MKRSVFLGVMGIGLFLLTSLAAAKDRKGPLTGTWDCQAHGGSRGDMALTLYLQQNKELVDGSISSPIGATQISSGTFKRNMLEIHVDTPEGAYVLMARLSKGALSGTWSSDAEKGTWEGKKHIAARQ